MSAGSENKLNPYLSPLMVWAFALGTSIGWGSLVVTSNTYLMHAGPAGSIAGLIAGAVIMIVISRNYHYMMSCFPDAGGAYVYTKETFGYDRGFLASWFLCLTYAAMFWANVTSLPLFSRYFLGDIFMFGRLYSLFGYDVYLGEALLSIAAAILIAILCARGPKAAAVLMTVLAIILSCGIVICFAAAMFGHPASGRSFDPGFIPDKNALSQIILIACISPWAFIGFESISHSAEEFDFPRKKVFRIMTAAVISAAILYIFVLLLSVSAYPPEYSSWLDYIKDLDNLDGIKGLPPFYAAYHYMGQAGVTLLIVVLMGLIVTSLIGNTTAVSRLLYALARDNIISEKLVYLNSKGSPVRAIMLLAILSIPVAFIGRTAIGWIVDVTTLGAVIIYCFVSAATFKMAGSMGDIAERRTGFIGVVVMIAVGLYILVPNFFSSGMMARETYFLFVIWGVIGFIFFRTILNRDKGDRFGHTIIVWVAMLSLVLFVALIWMDQTMTASTNDTMMTIQNHFYGNNNSGISAEDEQFIHDQMIRLEHTNTRTMMIVAGLFAFSLLIMLTNYSYMSRKNRKSEEALGHVQNIAYTDPLTGVKSKNAYVEKEKELNRNIENGSADEFAVVLCDVNGLKYVNDTFGHKAGDEYIKSASRMVCELFQHSPVFRIGGDEFVVILSGLDFERREEILEELNRRSVSNIEEGEVVIAAGCARYESGKDRNVHDIFERADSLMYENKRELKDNGAYMR